MLGAAERASGNATQASIINSTKRRDPRPSSEFDVVSVTRRFSLGLVICRWESISEQSRKAFSRVGRFGHSFKPLNMAPRKRRRNTCKRSRQLRHNHRSCLYCLDSSFRQHQFELSKPSFPGTLSSSNPSCLSAALCFGD